MALTASQHRFAPATCCRRARHEHRRQQYFLSSILTAFAIRQVAFGL